MNLKSIFILTWMGLALMQRVPSVQSAFIPPQFQSIEALQAQEAEEEEHNQPDNTIASSSSTTSSSSLGMDQAIREELVRILGKENDEPTSTPTESPAPSPSPSEIPSSSPTITAKPTDTPTSTPTDSPAPSPSPSEIPSLSPSSRPTGRPTESPSDQPSMSPSKSPSDFPTMTPSISPTDIPSMTPSISPTELPSLLPSISPSHAPSIAPSEFPTRTVQPSTTPSSSPSELPSSQPSVAPSQVPTSGPSNIPSSSPSVILTDLRQQFTSQLSLNAPLSGKDELDSFTTGIVNYIANNPPSSGVIRSVVVTVIQQNMVTRGGRRQRNLAEQVNEIDFLVTGEYVGSNPNFSLQARYGSAFRNVDQELVKLWVDLMSKKITQSGEAGGNVFEPLLQSAASILGNSNNKDGSKGGVPTGAKAGAILVAVFAVGLAIIASVYAVRHYDGGGKQQEIVMQHTDEESLHRMETQDSNENDLCLAGASRAPSTVVERVIRFGDSSYLVDLSSPAHNQLDDDGLPESKTSIDPSAYKASEYSNSQKAVMMSPEPENSESSPKRHWLLRSASPSPKQPDNTSRQAASPWLSRTSHSPDRRPGADPPTQFSHVDVEATRAVYEHKEANNEPTPRMSEITASEVGRQSAATRMAPSRLGGRALGASERAVASFPIADRISTFEKLSETGSSTYNPQSILNSLRSTLGARAVDGSETGGDQDLTVQARAFFNNLMSGKAKQDNNNQRNALQKVNEARPDSIQRMSIPKKDLYDVHAPPGPIGIVVDTSRHGPVVHSLKASSPMRGLINPGDVIVALDGQDTRDMTAATLTRLMASLSGKPERRITLMSMSK